MSKRKPDPNQQVPSPNDNRDELFNHQKRSPSSSPLKKSKVDQPGGTSSLNKDGNMMNPTPYSFPRVSTNYAMGGLANNQNIPRMTNQPIRATPITIVPPGGCIPYAVGTENDKSETPQQVVEMYRKPNHQISFANSVPVAYFTPATDDIPVAMGSRNNKESHQTSQLKNIPNMQNPIPVACGIAATLASQTDTKGQFQTPPSMMDQNMSNAKMVANPLSAIPDGDATPFVVGSQTNNVEQSQTSPSVMSQPSISEGITITNPIPVVPEDNSTPNAVVSQPHNMELKNIPTMQNPVPVAYGIPVTFASKTDNKGQFQTTPSMMDQNMSNAKMVANPISANPDGNATPVVVGSQTSNKEQTQTSPTVMTPTMSNAIVVANPNSAIADGTPNADNSQTNKNGSQSGQSSSSKKPRKPRKEKPLPEWLTTKYHVISKLREDQTRVDKTFFHKENTNIKFRSFKEVNLYEFQGILPNRLRGKVQVKEKEENQNDSTQIDTNKEVSEEKKEEVPNDVELASEGKKEVTNDEELVASEENKKDVSNEEKHASEEKKKEGSNEEELASNEKKKKEVSNNEEMLAKDEKKEAPIEEDPIQNSKDVEEFLKEARCNMGYPEGL